MDLLLLFVWTILAIRNVSISLPPAMGSSISLFLLSGRHPLSCFLFGRRRLARKFLSATGADRGYCILSNAMLFFSAKFMNAETYLTLSSSLHFPLSLFIPSGFSGSAAAAVSQLFCWGAISHSSLGCEKASVATFRMRPARVRRTSVCSAPLCNSHSEVHFRGSFSSLSLSTSPVWMHPHSRHHSSSSCALEFSSSVLMSTRGCLRCDINLLHLYKMVRYPVSCFF